MHLSSFMEDDEITLICRFFLKINCDMSLVSGSENGRWPAYVSSHGFMLAPVKLSIRYSKHRYSVFQVVKSML